MRSFAFILIALVLTPVFVMAQSVDSEIRAAIEAQARQEGLSDAEIDQMVAALSSEASAQGITAQDLQEPDPLPPATVGGPDGGALPFREEFSSVLPTGTSFGVTNILAILGGIAVLVILVMVWRKMEHGGALGAMPAKEIKDPNRLSSLANQNAAPNPFPAQKSAQAEPPPQFPQHF